MIGEGWKTEDLEFCFQQLVFFGGERGKMGGGGVITEWKDIPMELLLRIVSLVDDKTVIIASGVCTGWRDAICLGLTHLCLSWCKNGMNNLLLSLAPKFTKLKVLSLRETQAKPQLKDDAVEAVANFCPDLQDLDLSRSGNLTDRSLYALAHGCPNLTKLNISGCSSLGDVALAPLPLPPLPPPPPPPLPLPLSLPLPQPQPLLMPLHHCQAHCHCTTVTATAPLPLHHRHSHCHCTTPTATAPLPGHHCHYHCQPLSLLLLSLLLPTLLDIEEFGY